MSFFHSRGDFCVFLRAELYFPRPKLPTRQNGILRSYLITFFIITGTTLSTFLSTFLFFYILTWRCYRQWSSMDHMLGECSHLTENYQVNCLNCLDSFFDKESYNLLHFLCVGCRIVILRALR